MNEADMTDAEIDTLLERFDQTDPKLQRRIIARFVCENAKLKEFKQYVHGRLDAAGVPTDPDSPHKAEGCRIGGRLDIVLAQRPLIADMLKALTDLDAHWEFQMAFRNGDYGFTDATGVNAAMSAASEVIGRAKAFLAILPAEQVKGGGADGPT